MFANGTKRTFAAAQHFVRYWSNRWGNRPAGVCGLSLLRYFARARHAPQQLLDGRGTPLQRVQEVYLTASRSDMALPEWSCALRVRSRPNPYGKSIVDPTYFWWNCDGGTVPSLRRDA